MCIRKIQISVLGARLDFQANSISPLLSKQSRRPLSAGAEEGRERGRSCSLVHRGFKDVALGNSCYMEQLSAYRELFQTFCDQVGFLVKQTISEKGGHK